MEVCKQRLGVLARYTFVVATFAILTLLAAGCVTREVSAPPRSATEQLLLSTAADRAMATVNLTMFAGQTVYVDFTYFEGYDSKYVEGGIRDAFSRAGARLVDDVTNANVIVQARSGAYSINTNSVFFGFPSIPLPIPGTAEEPVTPAIAFYSGENLRSYAKFALLAYDNKSRAHLFSSGPLDGNAFDAHHAILFVSWWRSDIPERINPKYKAKYESWWPQYDSQNMPPPAHH